MKKVLTFVRKFIHTVFPNSKWGNVVYLILGLLLASWDEVVMIVNYVSEFIK
jgi:hypothetical protein